MTNKLALNTHFGRTILINDEKTKKQPPLALNSHFKQFHTPSFAYFDR